MDAVTVNLQNDLQNLLDTYESQVQASPGAMQDLTTGIKLFASLSTSPVTFLMLKAQIKDHN